MRGWLVVALLAVLVPFLLPFEAKGQVNISIPWEPFPRPHPGPIDAYRADRAYGPGGGLRGGYGGYHGCGGYHRYGAYRGYGRYR